MFRYILESQLAANTAETFGFEHRKYGGLGLTTPDGFQT